MQKILEKRWEECEKCVAVDASLAAIVMMGELLEALLLTRINAAGGIRVLSGNIKVPKERKSGKIKPIKDRGLWDMIEVAHEEKWVSIAVKSVSHVLRDYRNWIHPLKELTAGTSLSSADSRMLWSIAKEISKQVLR